MTARDHHFTATYARRSVCTCGFTALHDEVPIGTQYRVDVRTIGTMDMQCGGCGVTHAVTTIFAEGRAGRQGGLLPLDIFDEAGAILAAATANQLAAEAPPAAQIAVPKFCYAHYYELIQKRLHYTPDDPYMAATVVANILLFQAVASDPRVEARTAGNATDLTLVLSEIGCLACFRPDAFDLAAKVLEKGLSHAAAVSRFTTADPIWPYGKNAAASDVAAYGDAQ